MSRIAEINREQKETLLRTIEENIQLNKLIEDIEENSKLPEEEREEIPVWMKEVNTKLHPKQEKQFIVLMNDLNTIKNEKERKILFHHASEGRFSDFGSNYALPLSALYESLNDLGEKGFIKKLENDDYTHNHVYFVE